MNKENDVVNICEKYSECVTDLLNGLNILKAYVQSVSNNHSDECIFSPEACNDPENLSFMRRIKSAEHLYAELMNYINGSKNSNGEIVKSILNSFSRDINKYKYDKNYQIKWQLYTINALRELGYNAQEAITTNGKRGIIILQED